MPISLTQALDLPVVVVLIMFIPIGLWRGALREWIACAGIALGTLLANAAGTRWGDGFAQLANMDPKLGGFTVATAFFLASTLLIGYGGGVTLPYRPDLSWPNRGLGALLGLGNGFLIVGGLLRLMQERLFDGRSNSPLHTTALAASLIDPSVAWVYLGFFLSLLLCVILGLVRRVNEGAPLLEEYSPVYQVAPQGEWSNAARWQPQVAPAETLSAGGAPSVQVAHAHDTPGVRLGATPDAATTATTDDEGGPSLERAKQPTPPVENLDRPTPRPPAAAPARRATHERDTERIPLIIRPPAKNDDPTPIPRPVADPTRATGARQRREVAPPEAAAATASCPICGIPRAPQARFCGNCGHITGAAERRQIAR